MVVRDTSVQANIYKELCVAKYSIYFVHNDFAFLQLQKWTTLNVGGSTHNR